MEDVHGRQLGTEGPSTPPTACQSSSFPEVDSICLKNHTTLVPTADNRKDHISDEDDDWVSGSSSITPSIIDYEYENGRRYHAYKAGHYAFPTDESELDRLDLQHHIIRLVLNGELHLAPLEDPKKILDIGTGTGIWAIEMADRFPDATVVGTDLSPTQPTWVPDNVRFEISDVESDWYYKENSFDHIHARYMVGSISDWKKLIRQSFKHIKPGGYFEIQELDPRLASDDDSTAKSTIHNMCVNMCLDSLKDRGQAIPVYTQYKAWLEEEGFVDVKEYPFKIPVNTWPKDKRLKEIGKYQLMNYTEGCEAICIGLFTRVLEWQPAEIQVLLARLRAEFKDRTLHVYQLFVVLVARKPFSSTSRQDTPVSTEVSDSPKTPDAAVSTQSTQNGVHRQPESSSQASPSMQAGTII